MADDQRADIQRLTAPSRNPLAVGHHQFIDCLQKQGFVDFRDAESSARVAHSLGIALRAEYSSPPVLSVKGLETLEHRLTVVEAQRPGFDGERAVGLDTRIAPCSVVKIHDEHVVAENVAESGVGNVYQGAASVGDPVKREGHVHWLPGVRTAFGVGSTVSAPRWPDLVGAASSQFAEASITFLRVEFEVEIGPAVEAFYFGNGPVDAATLRGLDGFAGACLPALAYTPGVYTRLEQVGLAPVPRGIHLLSRAGLGAQYFLQRVVGSAVAVSVHGASISRPGAGRPGAAIGDRPGVVGLTGIA